MTQPGLGSAAPSTLNNNNLGASAGTGLSASSNLSNFNPMNPPPMKTLVYSPEIRILIAHGNKQYDVSQDITQFGVLRKENSASSLSFSLSNKDARYNGLFLPMDRVVVYLKRISWKQVFSGYLDSVPYQQMYGGQVNFRATCTLKRLMYTWWDPALPPSQSLFDQANLGAGVAGDGQAGVDAGLSQLLRRLLQKVGGWNYENIHIQNFPLAYLNFVEKNLAQEEQQTQQNVETFRHLFLGNDTSLGIGDAAGMSYTTSPAGAYGQTQTGYVADIIASCDGHGLGPTTVDLNVSSQLAQAAGKGSSSLSTDSEAWAEAGKTFTNLNTQTRNVDAAIIGVATALAETGLRMLANNADPASLSFPHDGMGDNTDSVGLFQQRNNGAWGDVSQRMNARQSADMFFNRLAATDWRNMDPGAAASMVQQNSIVAAYEARVNGFMQQAQQLVQAARGGGNGGVSPIPGYQTPVGTGAVPSPVGISSAQVGASSVPFIGGAAAPGANPAGVAGEVRNQAGKPNPDAQGAVNWALANAGAVRYRYGGPGYPNIDCSQFTQLAYRSIGINIGRTSGEQGGQGRPVPASQIQPGDILANGGHAQMVVSITPPTLVSNGGPEGSPATIRAITPSDLSNYQIRRFADWGGPDPSAPFTNPILAGPGAAPGTVGTGSSGTWLGAGSTEPIARNLFTYQFETPVFAGKINSLYEGERAFMEGQPLIQMIASVARSGLRNFASAPNGDFVAYFPDFFGLDGKPAVVNVEDIEMKNVQMDFSDDSLATHVYVAGSNSNYGMPVTSEGWLQTLGVATVENEWLFHRMIKIAPGSLNNMNGESLMRRYGARPMFQEFPQIQHGAMEKFLAIQLFMERWAEQYKTRVEFTFMPELFPGMRLNLVGHNLQVYVTEVEHQGNFTDGFTTSAQIMAPSNPSARRLIQDEDKSSGDVGVTTGWGPDATNAPADNTFFFGGLGQSAGH